MPDRAPHKYITSLQALSLVVGMIIGSGIFLKPGIVLGQAGGYGASLLAWVAGGLITLASALSIAEVASAIPRKGGLFAYLSELYGERVGFTLGWVQAVISYPASIAALAIAFATYAGFFIPLPPMGQKLLAVGALLFVTVMNVLSTRFGGRIQTISTVAKLIPIAGIVLFGLFGGAPSAAASPAALAGTNGAGFGVAILGTLWAYDGWIGVTNMAGELKNPSRVLPRVIFGGVAFVMLVYAVFNLALFQLLPYDTILASPTPGADAAVALFGDHGAILFAVGIMVSVFGAMNGYLMTAARVPQAMGERRDFPLSRTLKRLHPRLGTPANALIFQSLLAVCYIFSGTFNTLTDMVVFVLWIFFTMGVVGIFMLRRRAGGATAAYRVPLYPLTPLVGIVGGAYILVSTILSHPARSLAGIGIALLALPVYSWLSRPRDGRRG